jgi:hypothetical protein
VMLQVGGMGTATGPPALRVFFVAVGNAFVKDFMLAARNSRGVCDRSISNKLTICLIMRRYSYC